MTGEAEARRAARASLMASLRRLDGRADEFVRRRTGAADGKPQPRFADSKRLGWVLYLFMAAVVTLVRGLVAGQPAVTALGVLMLLAFAAVSVWQRRSQ